MNPRKRQASESLTRATKQQRTHSPYIIDNSGFIPEVGLVGRWVKVGKDIWMLTRDTLSTISRLVQGTNVEEPALSENPTNGFIAPPPSSQSVLPTRPPIPDEFQKAMGPPRTLRVASISSSAGSELFSPNSESGMTNGTYVTSPPSTATPFGSVPPSSGTRIFHPSLQDFLAESESDMEVRNRNRKYTTRKHIYEKEHKARIKREKSELVNELYQLKRSLGFAGDYRTYEGWLLYAAKIEGQKRKEWLSPTPSLNNLRAEAATTVHPRRFSFSHAGGDLDDLTADFLRRAIEKARDTLNGPQPPRPFIPLYEERRLLNRKKDDAIERRIRGPKLPSSLPPDDEKRVHAILNQRGVVSKFAREQVTDSDVSRLMPGQWLNDEIINFYGALILGRSEGSKENPGVNGVKRGKRKPLNVHYFSTFFWSKLRNEGYEKGRLAKWTKKFDLFSKDVILMAINHGNAHWTSAAINFRRKRIESFDSMGMEQKQVYKVLRMYLDAEHRNKKKKPFDFTDWEDYTAEDFPEQENGFDCGVFTCRVLEALSRGEEVFNFSQVDMPYLRRRMIWEIGNATLRDD